MMAIPTLTEVRRVLAAPPPALSSTTGRAGDSLVIPERPLPLDGPSIYEALHRVDEAAAHPPSGLYDFPFGPPFLDSGHLSGRSFELRELYFLERLQILRAAHQAWERNPWAKGGVRLIRAFTVGTGHTVTYRSAGVRAVLERFRLDPLNAVEERDKQFCEQLLLDGELFLRFSRAAARDDEGRPLDDRLLIQTIPAWWVEEIALTPDSSRTVTGYEVRYRVGPTLTTSYMAQERETIPAEDILHVAINKLGYEIRGRPELWAILPWLKAYKDWLEDRARINRYKGAMLYDVTIKSQTAATVQAKRSQYATPPAPGSVVIHTDNEVWDTVDSKIDAGNAAEDGRQIKLATAVGLGLPEYALADGSYANLASSTSQALPMLAIMADYQDLLANSLWRRVYDRVIALAIEAGTLAEEEPELDAEGEPVLDPEGEPRVITPHEAYDVAYPELDQREPAQLAQSIQILTSLGLMSAVTAQERAGLDPNIEAKRLAAQQQAEARAVADGLAIGERPEHVAPGGEGEASGEEETGGEETARAANGSPPDHDHDRRTGTARRQRTSTEGVRSDGRP